MTARDQAVEGTARSKAEVMAAQALLDSWTDEDEYGGVHAMARVALDAIVPILAAELRTVHTTGSISGVRACRHCRAPWPCPTEVIVRGWEA